MANNLGVLVNKNHSGDKLQTLQSRHKMTLEELENYRLLVDSVQDYAIFLMDAGGHIQTWNKGAEKNKGYKPDGIIGKHFSIFYTPEDVAACKPERELELALQFGRTEDEDWRVRKDGSMFWASVVITTLYGNDGQVVGFAKVTRDLTERKLQEDELRRANALLRAQQQELELMNQAKDEFISLASHQLRTPATIIKQLLGLFVEGFQPDIAEQHLELIKKAYDSNERQIEVVNSLLKVAQVDAGKVILRMDEISLAMLLEGVVDNFRDTFIERNQQVSLALPDRRLKMLADERHFRMAIENLVSNASKYTHAGGSISVSCVQEGNMARLIVADTGVGIAEEDIEMLFEKFKRIPNDLSDEVGGSGLGLYWARKVITLHGGRIEVQSTPDEGTTFSVYLPVVA